MSEYKKSKRSNGIVTSDAVAAANGTQKRSFGTKTRLLAALAVLVVAGGAVGWVVWHSNTTDTSVFPETESPAYAITDEQYAKASSQTLLKNPPAANMSADDLAEYYDELVVQSFVAKDYKEATKAYSQYVQATNDRDFSFRAYESAAKSYAALGDKTEALQVIDRAEAAMPHIEKDPDMRADYLSILSSLKQEVQQ